MAKLPIKLLPIPDHYSIEDLDHKSLIAQGYISKDFRPDIIINTILKTDEGNETISTNNDVGGSEYEIS